MTRAATVMFGVTMAMAGMSLATIPAMAQSGGSSNGSLVEICKTRYETAMTDVQGVSDPAKKAATMTQLAKVKADMDKGSTTTCVADLDKAEAAMK